MKLMNYTVLFEPIEDDAYLAVVPAIPGIITFGENLDEAREMVMDAIRCHLEGLLMDGEPFPKDMSINSEPIKEILSVSVNLI